MFSFFKKGSEKESVKIVAKEAVACEYNNIQPIADYFYKQTGITFESQMSILKSKVSSFAKQREIYSFEELLKLIKIKAILKQELIDTLTTNETYFYREFNQVKELVQLVKETKEKVKILCAPCATGEEPYSMTIALLEEGVSADKFSIVGIDINKEALEQAKQGKYTQRHIRNLSEALLQKYFTEKNQIYIINQNIKDLVHFEKANIFDDSFKNLGKFDFVFSRNMLIYFDKETKNKAKNILQSMRKREEFPVFFGHADLF